MLQPLVHLSVILSPSFQTTGGNSTKLATSLPLMVRVCESNIIFPCFRRPSIYPSCYLLNHWRESTKLATSLPLMVRVCESNNIFPSVYPASVHLSVVLFSPKPLGHHAVSNFSKELRDLQWLTIDCAF